ncbi:MAG: polymer-forming cytoskeletal protein [Candidatus Omnitrophica bacterium]|nr:polymer-forming cytoskeletal protein [Candidatus Omnitrophota bacterium]
MARRDRDEEKILDVDASMQGTLAFKDPVNLRINGTFEGRLDTKGKLTIGQNASVHADINGEEIFVSGKITGNIKADKHLRVLSSAHIVGDITAPVLSVEAGAILQGKCQMLNKASGKDGIFNAEELAKYLEVEISNIVNWADSGKIPAFKEGSEWMFNRSLINDWIAKEKAK